MVIIKYKKPRPYGRGFLFREVEIVGGFNTKIFKLLFNLKRPDGRGMKHPVSTHGRNKPLPSAV